MWMLFYAEGLQQNRKQNNWQNHGMHDYQDTKNNSN